MQAGKRDGGVMFIPKQIEAANEALIRYGFDLPWLAISAALEAAELAAWQDIKTVPNDETSVLLYDGKHYGVGWFSEPQLSWDWDTDGIPTHWRPLPPTPKTVPDEAQAR